MLATHTIQAISFDNENIYLSVDGQALQVPSNKVSPRLKAADEFQKNFCKISPSGYGIHWPLIDEDLSVDELLKVATGK